MCPLYSYNWDCRLTARKELAIYYELLRRVNRLPPGNTGPSPPPLTPHQEAIVAPQRPANGLSHVAMGPALPPHGADPSVRAMDESLLGTVLAKRPGPYGY